MSNIARKQIQTLIKDLHLYPELDEFVDSDDELDFWFEDDLLYGEFYLMKKLSLKYGFDIKKIKNSTTEEEYVENIKEELNKTPRLNSDDEFDSWGWLRFYSKREEIFSFIDNLDINDFDITLPGYAWFYDDYLNQFIDYSKTYDILSIYTTFYNKELSDLCDVDVIYNEFQSSNMLGHKARLDMVNRFNYNFKLESFPKVLPKKYDLIVFNLEYGSKDALDKTGLLKWVDGIGGVFNGDDILQNIYSIESNLTDNGIAIIKTPFTFISKLDDELIDKNIIDKIIYLPKEKESFAFEYSDVKNVYVIVRKNKLNDEIEFIDKTTGDTYTVKNELIKKHRGCANMHIYSKHNPMLEKLYRIKDDNTKQLEIISKESEMINKQIDELDFEDK